jgi:predicted DNA repair protein MutK
VKFLVRINLNKKGFMFSLLSLLDDIATTLDDVAVMTKVAIQKTSVLMSDDLAVNAAVVTGTPANRELPIVKSIFWGSLLNKVYCIAGVLILMSIYAPILKGILFIGGLYLSFEGVHKIIEKLFHKEAARENRKQLSEKEKIKGAVRTDLVLSIEIIVIAYESIQGNFTNKLMTLIVVGLAASILIYGMVALLVKVDDLGLYLVKKDYKKSGMLLVNSMPYTMKALGIVGTIAMLLVGGGIISHTFHLQQFIPEILQNLALGFIAGLFINIVINIIRKFI